MSDTLVAFLRARLNEDEAGARDAFGDHNSGGPEWTEVSSGALDAGGELHGIGDSAVSRHMACWDPARVLAEVDAKRRILAEHPILTAWRVCTRCSDFAEHTSDLIRKVPGPCQTLRLLALPHASHPDYRPEWAPEA